MHITTQLHPLREEELTSIVGGEPTYFREVYWSSFTTAVAFVGPGLGHPSGVVALFGYNLWDQLTQYQ